MIECALFPAARHPVVSACHPRFDVVFFHLPATSVPQRPGNSRTRLYFPAGHHHRLRVGTEQRYAYRRHQPLVAVDRRCDRSRRARRERASPITQVRRKPGVKRY
jgi:hypothetical protein